MKKHLKKKPFLNNLGSLFSARENHFNSLKSRLFPIPNLGKIAIREPTLEPAQDQKQWQKQKQKQKLNAKYLY